MGESTGRRPEGTTGLLDKDEVAEGPEVLWWGGSGML